ncbi:hypothetical protein CK203_057071 [Vitis vinifera]|uniref:Retrotransposon gag domain-containing protein n=1 Tax=Vitis vinifera TaxID=29760 RepID=A0A438GN89_VITVI|nr:hypothetical protein CK203_057071 [Vitis vinifera]
MELELKPSHSGHHYDSRVLIIHPDFGLPLQDHELIESGVTSLEESWRSIDQSRFNQGSDNSVEMSDELASTLASIQEFMAGTAQVFPPGTSHGVPFHLSNHCETAPPPAVTVSPPMIRLQDGGLAWDDRDGIPAASLPAKFRMPDIERYSGIGCPKIHLRLYNTVMRAHGIDDAQLVALFPMSLSGAAQRWFASVEPSRLRTWEDVAHEFLTQFAFSADIDVSRRELEATRQRPDESISSFVTRWRTKLRFARCLVASHFRISRVWFKQLLVLRRPSLEIMDRCYCFPDSKGKKPIGSFSRSGEVGAISYQHRRPAYHSPYRPPPVRAHFPYPQYQYQPDYVQEPYIAQTGMQPRPPHSRVATHPPSRPYAQRPIQGHDTERCSALHHAIQDLIDSGLVDLAGPSVTTNPLPAHSTTCSSSSSWSSVD